MRQKWDRFGRLSFIGTVFRQSLSSQSAFSGTVSLKKLYFLFLSYWMGYDRGDSFPLDFEPNGLTFGSKSKGKLSARSYPIQCEIKWKYNFLNVLSSLGQDFDSHFPTTGKQQTYLHQSASRGDKWVFPPSPSKMKIPSHEAFISTVTFGTLEKQQRSDDFAPIGIMKGQGPFPRKDMQTPHPPPSQKWPYSHDWCPQCWIE